MLDPDNIDGLLALAHNGYEFKTYSARLLLNDVPMKPNLDWSCCYYMLISAMCREDWEQCRKFLYDWCMPHGIPVTNISRFMPGSHYHTLGVKFLSYQEANEYIRKSGYRLGDVTTHYAPREGD